jgi:hypothetical protein
MKIYHQLGHNSVWNFDSHASDGVGDGFIVSPKHMTREDIEKRFKKIDIQNAIFDPQFFYPNYARGTLEEYDFHPAAVASASEFNTTDYVDAYALETAKRCLDFQAKMGFGQIVLPSRAVDGMPGDFIDGMTKFTLDPFRTAAQSLGTSTPLLLQLVLNDQMVKDEAFRNDVLNWLTGIDEISGVYLIGAIRRPGKQIQDSTYMLRLLEFVDALARNEMTTIVGYSGIESLVLSVARPSIVTVGTYFNTQIFNRDDFAQDDRTGGRTVPVRIYAPNLLQYIEKPYVETILGFFPGARDKDFCITKYAVDVFQPTGDWQWTQPTVYKHNLLATFQQLKALSLLSALDRYRMVKEMIESALRRFDEIRTKVALDSDNDGKHLYMWLNALNKFAEKKSWG